MPSATGVPRRAVGSPAKRAGSAAAAAEGAVLLSREALRRGRSALLGALAAVFAATACASRSRLPPPPALTAPDVPELLAETVAVASSIRRYQAVLGVRGEGRRGRFSGRLLVVFERDAAAPDGLSVAGLRMEAYGPVGGARWTLVAAPRRVAAVVRERQTFAEGAALAPFARALLGVPLGADDVAALLVGTGVPVAAGVAGGVAAGLGPEGVSALLPGGGRIWWDRDPASGEVRVEQGAVGDWQVRYPENEALRPGRVPRRIEVNSARIAAAFTVEELRLNAPLHPDSFALRIPSGFRRVSPAHLAGARWGAAR